MSESEVKKAKDQRKIDRMRYKTAKEKLKLKQKEAKIEARAKNGGTGGSVTFFDKRNSSKR